MPRRGGVTRRQLEPDAVFNSKLVSQLVNQILRKGQKHLAQSIVYDAMEIIKKKSGNDDPMVVLKKAMDNVKPLLEVKPRRVGGATYQVPVEVNQRRGTTLAIRWIVNYTRARKGKTMAERLAAELMDAANETGSAVKQRENLHKMAEANRAFAHYRW
jgi:small subunit ribosomal protein S7